MNRSGLARVLLPRPARCVELAGRPVIANVIRLGAVMENSYQAPNAEPLESSATKHLSFCLTPGSESPDTRFSVGPFRDAIVFTLVQQVPLLMLSALLLDGGLVFKRVAIASIAFCILTLVIMVRRGPNLPDTDILLVKWGYLPVLLVTCILTMVASEIMF